MQKALRINLLARNSAVKQAHRNKLKETKEEWGKWNDRNIEIQRQQNKYVKAERKNRREDWIQGPLAPARNVGRTRETYGAIDTVMANRPEVPESVRKAPKGRGSDWGPPPNELEWEGEGVVGNVAINDRVVVVNGPARIKGRIGAVSAVNLEREEVTVKGVNVVDVQVPEVMPNRDQSQSSIMTGVELPIPMADVRLVYHVSDEETGLNRDVIVRQVRGGAPYVQRAFGSSLPRHTRYIAGEETELPWPEENINDDVRREACDTPRFEVEKTTWLPSIYPNRGPLVPIDNVEKPLARKIVGGIMDELRNKHLPDRTRHDDQEWVKKKIVEDARAIWWRDRTITTPRAEKAREIVSQRQQQRQLDEIEGLGEDTLNLINELQARHVMAQEVGKRSGVIA